MNNFDKIKEIFENKTLEDTVDYLAHKTTNACIFCDFEPEYYCKMKCYEGVKKYLESEWKDYNNQ